MTSLRVVAELQNPSIRDRHWHQLMNATGVRFTMDEKTSLDDLLKLNLHEFEDTVLMTIWQEVQRTWSYLESIFIGSEDIRRQLPEDSDRFDGIDKDFKACMEDAKGNLNVVHATNKPGLYEQLESMQDRLTLCEKSLAEYLETKRLAFPRFYFVSSTDLLDILSNGNNPRVIAGHLAKLFDNTTDLKFADDTSKMAVGMYSSEREYVDFTNECNCDGQVEVWLNRIMESMRSTIRALLSEAVVTYEEKAREKWLFDYAAQVSLTVTQIWWTTEVGIAFGRLEEGYENSMKDYSKKQIQQLNNLITLLLGDLTKGDRQKIMTICTIDVHARDVFLYSYEYLGNTPRLVVTPLTDRCYVTLTQSLHLIMGGAPAGPAGTGKTETTKDLGRALVLSVIAVQVKCIQDAIRDKKERFIFEGCDISLVPSVGIFITMNPGYAGRTELPENLKALFRPCAMVVPDFELIAENMLLAEGFLDAKYLAKKFITLYTLCKELLSKQDHYDWGLRAIKSVLVVAGALKRSDRGRPEDEVLMRALRDFNVPKIVTDDMPVFLVLTLASNERIPLNNTMRLLFEISNLRTATPATVSRAGILFLNASDLGWNPIVTSWIDTREVQAERANMIILFEKYVPPCIEAFRTKFKTITPIPETAYLNTLCYLLECLLTPENVPFKTIKFPSQGTVFDYYINSEDKRFVHWSEMCAEEKFIFDPEMPLQATIVPTAETTRVRFFMDMLMEHFVVGNVPFNFYTTSMMLQEILEKPLEKKAGRNFGPPGSKRLVYFIDDMNMPEVDAYGTVQPHTLIRQHLDYSHWYDRTKLSLKEIHNCQYVSCMNPTSGSFTINPRLQRHFSVFAISFPGMDALESIYKQIFEQHLLLNKFSANCTKLVEPLIKAALSVHQKVSTTYLPTAIKFHYIFNLRDLSNIFQGMLFSSNDVFKAPTALARLYIHEATRVYCDKFTEKADIESFDALVTEICKKEFGDLDQEELFAKPLKFCHFSQGVGINKILTEALDSYNDVNAAMNLVLFEDAMSHILRINRILEMPRGNALLVGVGGSGKQSLSRLAAFIASLDVFQIQLRKGYSITDLKVDLASQYIKAGVKNQPVMFLMTDAQVPQEDFLVLINDLLASGEIPGLFADDELEEIISGVRNDVKATGMEDSRENCWSFFIDRVRRSLKVVLCFSPVGVKLRVRARKFPALVNCTSIDWFHEWPQDALKSVSLRFLNEIEEVPEQLKTSVSEFMAFVHTTVNEKSNIYRDNDRKYNYTTPKSFLEQIKLYENLLRSKKKELLGKMERLENGLEKLKATASQVDDLKGKLASQEVELKIKNENADKLIIEVGIKTEIVEKERAFAEIEEEKVAVISKEVGIKRADCERDLAAAEPALLAAQGALDTLNKNNLTELKSFGSPPPAVVNVVSAVMVLLAPGGKVPKDRSWKAAKSTSMANVAQFLDALVNYDKENIPDTCLKAIQPYLDDPDFNPEFIKAKSSAGAGLCSWVVNIVSFYRIFCDVEPKRNALAQANADLAAATEKLEADATQSTISLANRLVGGLASENVRWAESVALFKEQEKMLPGDVLLITAFVSYFGYFTKKYRVEMMNDMFLPFIGKLATPIPITPELDPISMLTDDADVASWNNEGLPADRMSKENATILCNCERWPLMVDPQLQGIKWIKKRYEGKQFQIVRLGNRGYLETIERSVSNGDVVLIENLSEYTDPVLDPLLGRNTIKKGRYIKIGLEDQLLADVVRAERPDLEELKAELTTQQNQFKITLKKLEDDLLAPKITEQNINEAREHYRSAANRASLLYFILDDLNKIHPMYQFSLKAFNVVFATSITRADKSEEVKARVNNLIDSVTFSVYVYATRGLFEKDKLTFTAQVAFQILLNKGEINPLELDFLLRFPAKTDQGSPVDFLSNIGWGGLKTLSEMEEFRGLDRDIEGSAKRWKKFIESECPEKEKFPQEWKSKTSLQKLCMMRCFRPDRMTYAVTEFIAEKLHSKYTENRSVPFATSYEETGPGTACFFILSPGVDPLKDVEAIGKKIGFTFDKRNFHNVSLGQGQEIVAEQAMELAAKEGHWVILQNVHLSCSRESEFKSILNSVCYFHAVVCERRKFGPQGWNRPYPFNVGDLTISIDVLRNYLEVNSKVPWDDLRYLFGEIMYGYHAYIDETLPPESPYLYGLHPNAEIGVLTKTSEELFRTLLEMQPKDSGGSGAGVMTMEETVKAMLDEIMEKLPEEFNLYEMQSKIEEITPYTVVAVQECERMNLLINEIRRSLKAVNLGLKGELTITPQMEALMNSFFIDVVPETWQKRAFPSMLGLTAWYGDLLNRIRDLDAWSADFAMPNSLWLGGLFNPQSFLTAIMQSMARKNEWPLDKMALSVDVLKKSKDDINAPPREGAYVHGLFMEGARWDTPAGCINESKLKELTPAMPVLFVKAVPIDRLETKNIYECPVYKTRDRGPNYVWTFNLKTKESANKWVLGGVAILLAE
ncbi:unnamed protein product [Oikopleura dioica]|uniref:Uncharacterized protein n=1 Tax=Oikopleura dioica TaxID=34765 RepID=E4YJ30_OIKDI|nr:unnamed protein product [Oikopleura dioica]